MEIAEPRHEYERGKLSRADLDPDPLRQFQRWFEEAMKAGLLEPNAMILATATASGAPSVRTVLLKSYDDRGFVFYTNYDSRKGREIAENDRVALLFPWFGLERQVAVTGAASKVSMGESVKYFLTRPRGSQMGAWVSHQSSVISSRSMLEMKLDEIRRKFAGGEIPLPSFWGGYRVVPREIEFWQGGEDRLHDRFLYSRGEGGGWEIRRLAP